MDSSLLYEYNTKNAEETFKIGKEIAGRLVGGETILMLGEAGAGKTVLTKGIAEGLGILERVTSPTFALRNEYEGKFPLHHLDMYRIEGEEEAYASGALDGISGEGDVTIVEWADNVLEFFNYSHFRIYIDYEGETDRRIRIFRVE